MSERIHVLGPTYIDHTIRLKDRMSLDGSSRIETEQIFPGGTGLCYAIALSRLENSVVLHSMVGTDEKVAMVHSIVDSEKNIEAEWQVTEGLTDYAYILIDRGNHKAVASRKEISNSFKADSIPSSAFEDAKAMVVTSFSNDVSESILTKISEGNVRKPFIMWAPHLPNCEAAGSMVSPLANVDHISLSAEEFEALYSQIGNPTEYGVKTVTVTNGKNGCDLLTKDGYRHYNAIHVVENPIDTNGAGEAFGAGFLTAYLETGNLDTSIVAGSYMGFLHIHREGSDFPSVTKKELLNMAQLARDNVALPNNVLIPNTV